MFDFIKESGEGSGFIYKNKSEAFVYATSSFTITTGTGTNTVNISEVLSGEVVVGLTLTGGTLSGDSIIESFGTFDGTSGTVVLSQVENFDNPTTVNGTGFVKIIDPDYPEQTVRGIVYLDGSYYVMTPDAKIYGSDLNLPFSWNPLNVIQALAEPDLGICLARQLNLIVAFGEYSTEFFYNAANPTGSPLLPYQSGFLELGCACAESVVNAENTLFFVGKARQKGPSVYLMEGTNPKKISTTYIDRILNNDDLANVTAYFIKTSGHGLYILTLPTTGVCLVYDLDNGQWNKWTQLYLYKISGPSVSSTPSASWSNGLVTVVQNNHDLDDGQYVEIFSSSPSAYNYSGVVNVLDENIFTYEISTNPGTYVSGMRIRNYKETYYQMAAYASGPGFDFVQDSTTGAVLTVDNGTYSDNGIPIKYQIQTSKFDNANNRNKYFEKLELIGDKVEATAYVRYSNDDYQTWSKYRPVDLSSSRSQLYRLGRGRRRAFDIICYDNQLIRMEALELSVKEGTT